MCNFSRSIMSNICALKLAHKSVISNPLEIVDEKKKKTNQQQNDCAKNHDKEKNKWNEISMKGDDEQKDIV